MPSLHSPKPSSTLWRFTYFIFIAPALLVIMFYAALGHNPNGLHLAIVNQEISPRTKECPIRDGCRLSNLSCRFLDKLPKDTIIQDRYEDTESAINALRTGNAWAVIYINENFSDCLVARVALGKDADNETLAGSEVNIWLDMSNLQIGLSLRRDLLLAYRAFARDLLKICDIDPKLGDIPIQFNTFNYDIENPHYMDFVAPGVITTIVFALSVASTSAILMVERSEKGLKIEAGVMSFKVFASYFIPIFVIVCIETVLIIIVTFAGFKLQCRGRISLVCVLILLQSFCGMGFGLLFSTCHRSERKSLSLVLGSVYPTLFLSGVLWPVDGMPIILRHISNVLPLGLSTASLRGIMTRGWNLSKPDVYLGFIASVVWILLFILLSCLAKFRK